MIFYFTGARYANAVELADMVLQGAKKQADYITTLLMVDFSCSDYTSAYLEH